MGALQPGHLILVLVIVLVIFGPGKLPQLGKAVGDGLRELKRATNDEPTTNHKAIEQPTLPVAAASAVATPSRACSQCNAAVPVTDRFCGACDANLSTPTTRSATPTAGL